MHFIWFLLFRSFIWFVPFDVKLIHYVARFVMAPAASIEGGLSKLHTVLKPCYRVDKTHIDIHYCAAKYSLLYF